MELTFNRINTPAAFPHTAFYRPLANTAFRRTTGGVTASHPLYSWRLPCPLWQKICLLLLSLIDRTPLLENGGDNLFDAALDFSFIRDGPYHRYLAGPARGDTLLHELASVDQQAGAGPLL